MQASRITLIQPVFTYRQYFAKLSILTVEKPTLLVLHTPVVARCDGCCGHGRASVTAIATNHRIRVAVGPILRNMPDRPLLEA